MERKAVFVKLQEIICDVLDCENIEISDNTNAMDIDGWDSLAQVLIIGELQNEFGVKFTSAEVNKFANVGELVDAIIAKK